MVILFVDNKLRYFVFLSFKVSVFFGVSILRELDARECICVHDGLFLPVDQHPSVTELTGGTCAEVLNDHVHFKNVNWTLVMYQGHVSDSGEFVDIYISFRYFSLSTCI